MKQTTRRWLLRATIGATVIAAAVLFWNLVHHEGYGPGIASGNGRVEATEILIATKTAGRVAQIMVNEGDHVTQHEVIARMDTRVLEAELEQAQAQKAQAESSVASANAEIAQQMSSRAAAVATLRQRQAELEAARQRYRRSTLLAKEGGTPIQEADDDAARMATSQAQVDAAQAQVAAADAAVAASRSKADGARASAAAVAATIRRTEADIADTELRAPRDARVQYRTAEPAEVIAAGGAVVSLADLNDVQMTFFLPEAAAGKLAVGSEARLVLDAWPDSVIPARISYVADVAQFTPKEVETRNEREKLMFRVRARIAPEVLAKLGDRVKSGLPGVAYTRVDPLVAWPSELAPRHP